MRGPLSSASFSDGIYDSRPHPGRYKRGGKLTPEQVVRLRYEFAMGYKNAYQLAAEVGLTQAGVVSVVQGSTYKAAGGLITWPGERLLPRGYRRGYCWNVDCAKPIAPSGRAQETYQCIECFALYGERMKRRLRRGELSVLTCQVCGKDFEKYLTRQQARRPPPTCSRDCGIIFSGKTRSKRPDSLTDDALRELYWGRNLTSDEISDQYNRIFSKDAVILWLRAANIPLRRATSRTLSRCAVEGCDEAIHKQFNGTVWYGRLCKAHLRERDGARRRFYESQVMEARGIALQTDIAALTRGLPDAVKRDAESEIMVAVLSSELALPITRESVKPYIAKVFRENADAWKFLSIAAPTREGDDAQTWGERLGIA